MTSHEVAGDIRGHVAVWTYGCQQYIQCLLISASVDVYSCEQRGGRHGGSGISINSSFTETSSNDRLSVSVLVSLTLRVYVCLYVSRQRHSPVHLCTTMGKSYEVEKFEAKYCLTSKYWYLQEAQIPQRNSASAAHVYLGWLTDRAVHRTPQNRRRTTRPFFLPLSHSAPSLPSLWNFALKLIVRKLESWGYPPVKTA